VAAPGVGPEEELGSRAYRALGPSCRAIEAFPRSFPVARASGDPQLRRASTTHHARLVRGVKAQEAYFCNDLVSGG
jgi:hypothetical protein